MNSERLKSNSPIICASVAKNYQKPFIRYQEAVYEENNKNYKKKNEKLEGFFLYHSLTHLTAGAFDLVIGRLSNRL